MGNKLAAVGLAAAIGVGGLTVAAVNPLGVAGAQDTPAATTTTVSGEGAGSSATREGPLKRALAKLVADGTLTQAQADAVTAATKAEAEAGKSERIERRKDRRTALIAVAAEAIGSTPEDVKAGLADGTSIAAQAKAKGVDRQVVDDALTAHINAGIDAAVTDGTLTAERAAKAKEHVGQAVDRILDADGSGAGGGRGSLRDRIKERRGN
jgi:polyhydroxyalkanoate synthesis regulator phasin